MDARSSWTRREGDAIAAAVGVLILVIGMIIVRNGTVSGPEKAVFRAINDLPGALYPALWPFQQLGAILVGPIVAIVAAITKRYRLALAALTVSVLKLVFERVVKAFVSRDRPGTTIGTDVHLRGNVPAIGESFVSGHAVLITALACIVAPYLRGRWKIFPWALVAMVMLTRVYVGAHNPLDVLCGAALGLAIGSVVNLAFGVPADVT